MPILFAPFFKIGGILNSVKAKITIPVILVLVALSFFIWSYVSTSVENFANDLSMERINGAAQSARAFVRQLERYNRTNSLSVSGNEDIIRLVTEWNDYGLASTREQLYARLSVAEYELEETQFIVSNYVISDAEGRIILRTTDFYSYGDYGLISPVILAALDGRRETVYTSTIRTPMAISSAAPIFRDDEIIGTVVSVLNISSVEFVEEFAEIFNAEITVFSGSYSLASTLYVDREAGVRAIGTSARADIAFNVLVRGIDYDTELDLFGVMHHGFYFPLYGWGGYPIGMFFIGFSIEEAISDTALFMRYLAVIGLIGIAVAAAVMLSGIIFNVNKVTKLAKTVANITEGGDYSELEKLHVSNDEFGVLSSNIVSLFDAIRKLSSDRRIPEIEQHIGEIERHAVAAETANKAKTEFLSRMSHEIRTPLSAILGITEIQLRITEGETKDAFEKIFSSGDMLLGIINDILDLSKIESGKMELITEKYDVSSMINDTVQLNIMHIEDKPIKFEVSVNESIPAHLYGDELRIKQILSNILSNSFKYTNKGTITLSVGKVAYTTELIMLIFTVTDTGQGMTPQQINDLFEDFTRFNVLENRHVEGAGLGMSIVKNLVRLMEGTIKVESDPGSGSTFTIRIPQKIADHRLLGKEVADNIGSHKIVQHRLAIQTEWEMMPYGKILIVDDTSVNIKVAKGLLAPYELQIDTAESGFEAIEKLQNGNSYDLILMDHMMPKMDGVETVQRIRDMGYTAPIAAFTANALMGNEEDFLAKGFDGFISKPIQSLHLNSILYRFVRDSSQSHKFAKFDVAKSQIDHDELRKEFANSQKDIIQNINHAIESADFKTAQLHTHTLKSLAGLIGETNLMNLAGKCEAAFRRERLPVDTLEILSSETSRVLNKINKTLTERPKAPPPSPEEIKIIFEKLESLLANNNTEAITLLPTLATIPDSDELISHIENFNFSIALKCLQKLK